MINRIYGASTDYSPSRNLYGAGNEFTGMSDSLLALPDLTPLVVMLGLIPGHPLIQPINLYMSLHGGGCQISDSHHLFHLLDAYWGELYEALYSVFLL